MIQIPSADLYPPHDPHDRPPAARRVISCHVLHDQIHVHKACTVPTLCALCTPLCAPASPCTSVARAHVQTDCGTSEPISRNVAECCQRDAMTSWLSRRSCPIYHVSQTVPRLAPARHPPPGALEDSSGAIRASHCLFVVSGDDE